MVAPVGADGKVKHYRSINDELVEREVVGLILLHFFALFDAH